MAWMALPLIFLLGPVAEATLLMEENFDYATGRLKTVSAGTWVWISGDSLTNYLRVGTGSLSYSGYPSSGTGNMVTMLNGAAEDDYRQFATQAPDGSVYVSFLLRVNELTGMQADTSTLGDYLAALLPSTSTTAYVGRICVKRSITSGAYKIGIRASGASGAPATAWAVDDLNPGTTYLVAVKYALISGTANDSVYLWLNPSLGPTQPETQVVQIISGSDPADIGRLALRQGTYTPTADIDGIRVGTEWGDISGLNAAGPNVASTSPANGASNVLPNASISVTFDRLVNWATVDTSSFVVTGRRQTYYPADSIRPAGNSASFTYYVRDSLRKSDTVTVTLTTAIRDTAGDSLAANYSWSFYTLVPDYIPPVVTSTSPANGQEYVPVDASVEINFNEILLPSSVTASAFSITGRRTPQYSIGAPVLSNGDRRVTIQPVGGFQYKDTITVSVSSAITDLSGNALRDTSFSFTTKLRPGITIRDIQYTTDPSGNSPYVSQNVTVAGVVTGVVRAGNSRGMYFIQDGKGPWNGVYCYDRDRFPAEGDSVTVSGTVIEYYGLTEISPVSSFNLLKKGVKIPEPVVLPTCSLSVANPNAEAYEGVLVATNKVTVSSVPNSYFEWDINDGSGPATNDDFLDSLSRLGYTPVIGDSLARVQGIFHASYGWKILPRFTKDIVQFKPVRFLSSMPANGKANVPSQVGIRLEFDKPLNQATVIPANFAVTGSLGGNYPLTVSYDSLNYLVTLKAQPALTPGETVSVWVSYALRDTFGWYLDGNRDGVGSNDTTDQVRFSFTTLLNPTRIADVQRPGSDGFTPVLVGQTVTVEGVVTGPANIISSSTSSAASSYIQDASGGVNLYGGSKSDFDLGRRVVATGVVTEYNGVTEVAVSSAADISVWDLADSLPRPKTMIYNQFPTESIEGLLIDFEGIVNAPPAYAGGGYNLEVRNGDAVVALRYGETSGFDNSVLTSGVKVYVTGIVSQYDKEPPYSTGYQIVPRFPEPYVYGGRSYPADIELITDLTPPSESPVIAGVTPNPFSPDWGEVAWLELNAPATDRLTLRIYDLKGRLVKTCLNNAPGGHQTYPWDGKDNIGRRANIGIYIAHLRSVSPQGGSVDRTKLVVLGTPLK
jgi:DNA/RNA endonuclease YhcR with UshA esterase domain